MMISKGQSKDAVHSAVLHCSFQAQRLQMLQSFQVQNAVSHLFNKVFSFLQFNKALIIFMLFIWGNFDFCAHIIGSLTKLFYFGTKT
jgi:hypothetical protein